MAAFQKPDTKHTPRLVLWCLAIASISSFLLIFKGNLLSQPPLSCISSTTLPPQIALSLVHYAVSPTTPQQTLAEITLSLRVLQRRSPCNFLVFGLGHDSLLWQTLNHKGRTLFLEESHEWMKQITGKHPDLKAHLVDYKTMLKQSDDLLQEGRSKREGACRSVQNLQNSSCRLALGDLPQEVYSVEWDVIMIDAPRGYFAEAPGRMKAIFSAGVMGRSRRGNGSTDIFLHDVDRPVERTYAEEFLCRENLVEEAPGNRLWHFEIAPASGNDPRFCKNT